MQCHGAGRVTRLPRGERRKKIVAAATDFFAEQGFQGGTRALAARLGVTQALLYRYFRSKDDLIAAVLHSLSERREPPTPDAFLNGDPPLSERVGDLFVAYLDTFEPVDLRLMFRAELDGQDVFERIDGLSEERIVRPMVAALRSETGLPDLGRQPMLAGEREIALGLYGSVLFAAAQRMLGDGAHDGYEPTLRLYARMFVDGARKELPRVHALPAEDPLAQPLEG